MWSKTDAEDAWAGLLCTIGPKLNDTEQLPENHVCNYLFYDSVYKKGSTPFDPKNLDPELSIFLDGGKQLSKTTLGIGFAYKIRVLQLSFPMGFVAFDVDYDDFGNVCTKLNRYGAFTRLYTLNDILTYFQGVFDNAAELQDCLKLSR
ncbi:hypothetical protein HPB52_002047 [Rhipicephalus sanguineus]|uniref:Uncharacterized protein n=1 Tax=Rhipicephalus sanguineus TaxID=34632 RepID=A0A9D4PH41_RHISA|nr:hypothetical protein HPB52_002047 [Rhipicephalus sanguineus]